MAANPVLSKTRGHKRNVFLLYLFWLLGLLLQLLQRVCIDPAPIGSPKSLYGFSFFHLNLTLISLLKLGLIDTSRYELAFVLSMVPIASAGMNLIPPWPGSLRTLLSKVVAQVDSDFHPCSSVTSSRDPD
jgi:hypothetical protein